MGGRCRLVIVIVVAEVECLNLVHHLLPGLEASSGCLFLLEVPVGLVTLLRRFRVLRYAHLPSPPLQVVRVVHDFEKAVVLLGPKDLRRALCGVLGPRGLLLLAVLETVMVVDRLCMGLKVCLSVIRVELGCNFRVGVERMVNARRRGRRDWLKLLHLRLRSKLQRVMRWLGWVLVSARRQNAHGHSVDHLHPSVGRRASSARYLPGRIRLAAAAPATGLDCPVEKSRLRPLNRCAVSSAET